MDAIPTTRATSWVGLRARGAATHDGFRTVLATQEHDHPPSPNRLVWRGVPYPESGCRQRTEQTAIKAHSTGRGNTSIVEVLMATMRERQRAVQLYRGQIASPGRPTVAWREDRVKFWAAIACGFKTEDAAVEAGVSSP